MITDANGVPLACLLTGANAHSPGYISTDGYGSGMTGVHEAFLTVACSLICFRLRETVELLSSAG